MDMEYEFLQARALQLKHEHTYSLLHPELLLLTLQIRVHFLADLLLSFFPY
jgi:hypothetical protein